MLVGSRYLRNVVAEICDVVYWNRLSLKLLVNTGEAWYADEIERSLYNSLLVGSNREGTWGLRRLRLTHEHIKAQRHCSLEHHHCCVDNLPRGLFQASETAILADESGIRLALFNPGRGHVVLADGTGVSITVGGDYPYGDGEIPLTITVDAPVQFSLRIRIPEWAHGSGTPTMIDGRPAEADASGWIPVYRTWKPEDTIVLSIPSGPRVEWFEPRVSESGADGPTPELIAWHESQWPKLGFMRPGVGQDSTLDESDVQPHERAGLLFRGPVLLGLDRRVIGTAPFPPETQPLPVAEVARHGSELRATPDDGGPAYELRTTGGRILRLLPFDRLGATWDRSSEFTAWTVT
jgi:hypothetical protein